MCVTMPGQVVAVDATGALVDIDGRRVRAAMRLHPTTSMGEWVMVAAGTIVDRLSAREAAEIRAALRAAYDAADPNALADPNAHAVGGPEDEAHP